MQPVARERVIAALWGDAPPPEAAAALHALRAYERLRVRLSDELGVDPSRQTQQLYVDLLG